MTNPLTLAFTDADWAEIKDVVYDRLDRDADEIELTRPAGKLMQMVGVLTTTTSLRSAIETAASLHIAASALDSQTPGYKERVKRLQEMRVKVETLRNELMDAISPSVTFDDGKVRQVFLGGDLRAKYGLDVDPLDEAGCAFDVVTTILDASLASMAAQPPQQTANSRKVGRDRFWNEMVAIWLGIGGAETGIAAAEFLVSASQPVFDRVRAIGGRKTTASMPLDIEAVADWLRLRAKARRAATT
jgi:hypothetical protein